MHAVPCMQVTAHLRRVEQNPLFPVKDFLMLLFRFTFLQPETDGFVHCLEVRANDYGVACCLR